MQNLDLTSVANATDTTTPTVVSDTTTPTTDTIVSPDVTTAPSVDTTPVTNTLQSPDVAPTIGPAVSSGDIYTIEPTPVTNVVDTTTTTTPTDALTHAIITTDVPGTPTVDSPVNTSVEGNSSEAATDVEPTPESILARVLEVSDKGATVYLDGRVIDQLYYFLSRALPDGGKDVTSYSQILEIVGNIFKYFVDNQPISLQDIQPAVETVLETESEVVSA